MYEKKSAGEMTCNQLILNEIVLGMAMAGYGYNPENHNTESNSKAMAAIMAGTKKCGLPISPNIINDVLSNASEMKYLNQLIPNP